MRKVFCIVGERTEGFASCASRGGTGLDAAKPSCKKGNDTFCYG